MISLRRAPLLNIFAWEMKEGERREGRGGRDCATVKDQQDK